MCGICSTTGVNILPTPSLSGGTNPLDGNPLQPNQTVVTGPAYTGPRQTVVDVSNPSSWPPWIVAVNGQPTDTGAAGGTFTPQILPEISVTGFSWWWIPLLLLGLLIVTGRKR